MSGRGLRSGKRNNNTNEPIQLPTPLEPSYVLCFVQTKTPSSNPLGTYPISSNPLGTYPIDSNPLGTWQLDTKTVSIVSRATSISSRHLATGPMISAKSSSHICLILHMFVVCWFVCCLFVFVVCCGCCCFCFVFSSNHVSQ